MEFCRLFHRLFFVGAQKFTPFFATSPTASALISKHGLSTAQYSCSLGAQGVKVLDTVLSAICG